MAVRELTNDSKAILLLCSGFAERKPSQGSPSPLGASEYSGLAAWLHAHSMRPGELLGEAGMRNLEASQDLGLGIPRVKALLRRGAALALAAERWLNKGLWIITRSDERYPKALRDHLKQCAPPVLFGAGGDALLGKRGLAIIGSRDADDAAREFTCRLARACADDGVQVVSGGARGVDQEATVAALDAGGTAVAVLADSLMKAAVSGRYRQALRDKQLALISTYSPEARFTVGNAMGRNKYIYALASCALVVSASDGKGGTWTGAIEELRREQGTPVLVRVQGAVPPGNRGLLKKGAKPFPQEPWTRPMKALLSSVGGSAVPSMQRQLVERSGAIGAATLPESPEEHAAAAAGKAYDAVLPMILAHLRLPKTGNELATELDVRRVQLDDWLKRALRDGRILRKGRPAKYRAAPAREQELPFGGTETALPTAQAEPSS